MSDFGLASMKIEGGALHPDEMDCDFTDEQYKTQLEKYVADTGDVGAMDAYLDRVKARKRSYIPTQISCDFSEYSLYEAVRVVGPSFVYDVYVSEENFIDAKKVLKDAIIECRDNPLWSHANLHVGEFFGLDEWCVCAGDKCVGSEGA